MKKILIDTSAWAAISDNKDRHHASALNFIKKINGKYKLITTNYVLDETYTLLLMNAGYQTTIAFKQRIDIMVASQVLEIVWIDDAIANQSWQIFTKFNVDKEWSFTDCTSYAVMKQLNIAEVFILDHHFAQMGFVKQP
ncbi:MAG: PIN domain-containing protein [Pseudanabaena sp. M090S1SP2A07QC]|nr:PIN domain-containing protein [Pseudanabaena sp. M090S1SP2A07QC]MCA6605397.1 PIN domain-containing protein [Pseudanabaena sp. M007S1SP1A06QC]